MFIKCIMSAIADADYSRPSGKCGICGHQTYLIKGSMSEDVCPWCAVVRILIPLRLPIEVIRELFGKVELKRKKELRIN